MRLGLLLSIALLSCASRSPTPIGVEPAAEATPPPEAVASDCGCGTAPGCRPCPPPVAPSAAPAVSGTGALPPPAQFPPTAISPPFERTAKPGDGVWSPLAVQGAGASSPLAKTRLHPHGIRGDVVMELVAIDTSRLSMELVLGTQEPEGYEAAEPARPGMVPPALLDKLVAVTNGGFKKRHGGHGVGVGAIDLVPPSADFCTFARTTTGSYEVGPWTKLAAQRATFAWYRQAAPCLVEDGAKHADTTNEYKAKRWGGAEDGRKDIRRSAIGVGRDPAVLYFAIGDWVTSEWLANGLVAAGITTAAQLDINYSYTRFIVYEHRGPGDLVATSPLLQELKAPRKEYWAEASPRDFFFLAWR